MDIFFDNNIFDFLNRCRDFILANPALNNEILANCAVLSLSNQKLTPIIFITCLDNGKCVGAFIKLVNSQLNMVAGSSTQAISEVIDVFIEKEISITRCFGACAEEFVKIWQSQKNDDFNLHRTLIAYELNTLSDCGELTGKIRQATLDDFDIIMNWRKNFFLDVGESFEERSVRANVLRWITRHESFFLVENGVCCSLINAFDVGYDIVRMGAVYTPKKLRGRGYAKSLVQQISASIKAQGKKCILDADLNNPVSNHIYKKIGYVDVGELRDYILL